MKFMAFGSSYDVELILTGQNEQSIREVGFLAGCLGRRRFLLGVFIA